MDTREQLVDNLDLRTLPVPLAEPINLGRNSGEDVFAERGASIKKMPLSVSL